MKTGPPKFSRRGKSNCQKCDNVSVFTQILPCQEQALGKWEVDLEIHVAINSPCLNSMHMLTILGVVKVAQKII